MTRFAGQPPWGIKFEYADIDGNRIRLASSEIQSPQPPLLIFNGFGADLEMLMPLMKAFTGRRVLSYDIPGTGKSPTSTLPISMARHARIAAGVLDHYSLERVDVLGFSWGGFLAQEFALRFSGRCRRLVLAATSPGALMVPAVRSLVQFAAWPSMLVNVGGKSRWGLFYWEGERELLEKYLSRSRSPRSSQGLLYQALACGRWSSVHWLHEINQPTLILAGTEDTLSPVVNSRFMALQIPDSQLVEIEGGHLFLFFLNKETLKIIDNFLSS